MDAAADLQKKYKPAKGSTLYENLRALADAERAVNEVQGITGDLSRRLQDARAVKIQTDWSKPIPDKELQRVYDARQLVPMLQEALQLARAEQARREQLRQAAAAPVESVVKQFERIDNQIARVKATKESERPYADSKSPRTAHFYRRRMIELEAQVKQLASDRDQLKAAHCG